MSYQAHNQLYPTIWIENLYYLARCYEIYGKYDKINEILQQCLWLTHYNYAEQHFLNLLIEMDGENKKKSEGNESELHETIVKSAHEDIRVIEVNNKLGASDEKGFTTDEDQLIIGGTKNCTDSEANTTESEMKVTVEKVEAEEMESQKKVNAEEYEHGFKEISTVKPTRKKETVDRKYGETEQKGDSELKQEEENTIPTEQMAYSNVEKDDKIWMQPSLREVLDAKSKKQRKFNELEGCNEKDEIVESKKAHKYHTTGVYEATESRNGVYLAENNFSCQDNDYIADSEGRFSKQTIRNSPSPKDLLAKNDSGNDHDDVDDNDDGDDESDDDNDESDSPCKPLCGQNNLPATKIPGAPMSWDEMVTKVRSEVIYGTNLFNDTDDKDYDEGSYHESTFLKVSCSI